MRKTKKNQEKFCMDLPKILLTGLFFFVSFFFGGFLRIFGQLGLGEQKTSRKTKKTNFAWTYPRFFSQDCFFVSGFLRVFGQLGLGEQKTSRKTKKTKKNNFAWTYPRFFSQDCFFWVFLVFFEFLDNWAWESKKPREKPKKPILHGLTQDSSHRIVFFFGFLVFPEFLDIWKAGNGKKGKKQSVQEPNAPSVAFWLLITSKKIKNGSREPEYAYNLLI